MSLMEVAGSMSGDVFLGGELEPEPAPTTTDEVAPDSGATYIRGGAGVQTTDRTVGVVTAWFCLLVVLASSLGLGAAAIRHDIQVNHLHDRGVAVTATVDSCVALASGTGVTSDGFQCSASYTFRGRHYSERLHNTYLQFQRGQAVAAVTDPADPGVLSLAAGVKSISGLWKAYVVPAALLIVFTIGAILMWRRRRTQPA